MKQQPISFTFETTHPKFWPETATNQKLRDFICGAFPFNFSMVCKSPKNSYQLISDFDHIFQQRLESQGCLPFELKLPNDFKKEHDLAIQIDSTKVVFEIEKANWEKMFYDLFKAHVYLQSGADYFVLMLPETWGHQHGEKEIFEISRKRIEQSKKYGFGRIDCFERILLVGFDQKFENRNYSEEVRELIRQQCKTHFDSPSV